MTQPNAPKYWRSLDELEQTPEFLEFMHREFPVAASEYPEGISRRRWMQLMGASFALASVAGCRWETEKIAPLVHRPEGYIPGKPQRYATSIEIAGAPRHLLVTCYDGRPIKIEGNPEHPGSLGAADGFSQASTLTLYDPDRSTSVHRRLKGETSPSSWLKFGTYSDELIGKLRSTNGEGLAVLMQPSSSLSREAMVARVAEALPSAKFYEYAPLGGRNETAGTLLAFGSKLRTHYKLADAKVVATFDADLLCSHPASTRYARDFAGTRELDGEHADEATMSRLYAFESQMSITGAAADHRASVMSSEIGSVLGELRDTIEAQLAGGETVEPEAVAEWNKVKEERKALMEKHASEDELPKLPKITREMMLWCLASDLVANKGSSVVAVGASQPVEVHAIGHQINSMLENLGKTVVFTELPASEVEKGTIVELAGEIEKGVVSTLLIIEGNPAYDAPAELEFAEKIEKVPEAIRFGYYEDETSVVSNWHLPACHPLECWGDALSYEGVPSVGQPLIDPLTESKSVLELLGMFAGGEKMSDEQIVREALGSAVAGGFSDDTWAQLLHDGFAETSMLSATNATLADDFDVKTPIAVADFEVVFTASSSTYDGRFANNGWLQETPDFITKVCWDNVATVSPHTANKLGVKMGDVLKVAVGGTSVELPVYVLPGQANGSIGVALGYGRTGAGKVGGSDQAHAQAVLRDRNETFDVVGANSYKIRKSDGMYIATDVKPTKTTKRYKLATTQDHFAIDVAGHEIRAGRIGALVREATLDEYQHSPDFADHRVHVEVTEPLWDQPTFREMDYAWGMSIDLNKCIGCNACVVACQAENNVPVVGKEQVIAGRQMHWIRIDRYFSGELGSFDDAEPESPNVSTQMVTCMQCETAPCEEVCPVAATVHSDEGLNDMVYNRCVGTRYCANNCPYKVRRFNYFHNTGYMEKPENELLQLALNPEVTVRSRGVMEKCTYCVQRIATARTEVRITGEPIQDGDVKTACQQACASQAIEFGNLNDKESRVSKAHANPRSYGMLTELKTKPRTQYLAKVRNTHPRLSPPYVVHHGHHGEHEEGEHHENDHDNNHSDHHHDEETATMRRPAMLYDIDTSRV